MITFVNTELKTRLTTNTPTVINYLVGRDGSFNNHSVVLVDLVDDVTKITLASGQLLKHGHATILHFDPRAHLAVEQSFDRSGGQLKWRRTEGNWKSEAKREKEIWFNVLGHFSPFPPEKLNSIERFLECRCSWLNKPPQINRL